MRFFPRVITTSSTVQSQVLKKCKQAAPTSRGNQHQWCKKLIQTPKIIHCRQKLFQPRKEKNEDDSTNSTNSVNSTSLIRGNLPPHTRVFPVAFLHHKTSHGKPAFLSHQSGFSTRALMNRGDKNFPLRKSPSQNENEMCQTSNKHQIWVHNYFTVPPSPNVARDQKTLGQVQVQLSINCTVDVWNPVDK